MARFTEEELKTLGRAMALAILEFKGERYLTAKQAAKVVGVSEGYFRSKAQRLPSIKYKDNKQSPVRYDVDTLMENWMALYEDK